MLRYPDFFESGYKFKWDKDVSHYLDKVADKDDEGKLRGYVTGLSGQWLIFTA